MLKEFDLLPLEMRTNILRYNPYMRRMNKTFYETTKQFYYEEYCDLPISQNEFINYVNHYEPEHFKMIVDKGDTYKVFTFNSFGDHKYDVEILTLSINNTDVEEYKIITDFNAFNVDLFKNLMFLFRHNFKWHVYYDLKLTQDIVNTRSCAVINPNYGLEYTQKNFENNMKYNIVGGDLNTMFSLITKIYYMKLNNENLEFGFLDFGFLDIDLNTTYDEMGNAIDYDMEEELKKIIEEYNEWYQLTLTNI
jgi:hypothetical protein